MLVQNSYVFHLSFSSIGHKKIPTLEKLRKILSDIAR